MLLSETIPLWTALTALATVTAAVVAAFYTYFTARLLRAQSEPNVIVFVRHDPDRPSILDIRIENIGRDVAHDVKFQASRPIPSRAFGLTEEGADPLAYMTDGPLVEGIPALGPGDYREITWGQYGGLRKALGDDAISLSYTYRKGRRKFAGSGKLDIRSYVGTDISERPPLVVARGIDRIAKSLDHIDTSLAALSEALRRESKQGTV
jgi:hypothetical protein